MRDRTAARFKLLQQLRVKLKSIRTIDCEGKKISFRLSDLKDSRPTHIPKILETPKGKEQLEDIENLKVLRSLIE